MSPSSPQTDPGRPEAWLRRPGMLVLVLLAALLGLAVSAAAPQEQQYLIVGVPGSKRDTVHPGVGLLVFDVARHHRFITHVPVWAADEEPEIVRGMTVFPARSSEAAASGGPFLYISTTRRLGAVDLASGSLIWEQDFGGDCCERVAVSPDGRTLYAPAFGKAQWYVVDAASGELEGTVPVMGWPRSTELSPDGDRAFLASWESRELLVYDTASDAIVRPVGPFTDYVCPFTTNERGTMAYANVDGLVGFEIGDLLTGLVIERLQIDDYTPEQLAAYECPSHGIAFGPGDRELWVADGVGSRLRVFDSTPIPPVLVASIQLARQPRWVTFGLDGRYVYASTGEVVDAASRQIVATLKDASGRVVESERMVDVSMFAPPTGWKAP